MYTIIMYLLLFSQTIIPAAITYELNGQRFGDSLSCYCKAKLFSTMYGLPLFYVPFKYSDQLALHKTQTLYTSDVAKTFDSIVRVNSEEDIKNNLNKNVLFVSHFYSHTPDLYEYGFKNSEFSRTLKKDLTPIIPVSTIEKKPDTITVALHVRKGGGFDKPLASQQIYKKYQYADQQWPTKFPPDQFYLDQIKLVKKLVGNEKKLLIYLFTDDPNPALIVQRYKEYLNDTTIRFTYRTDNSHDTNVVEDFYLMSQCDCLIRSTSLFARASQLVGNHQIIMYPIVGTWVDNKIIINPAGIIIRDE